MTPKIFDRTYLALKREVTSGRYLPGQRLQARSLAETLKTSTSPVTNAMRQLVGEDILDYSAPDGFIIPRVTERRLTGLYRWSAWLTSVSAGHPEVIAADRASPDPPSADVVTATETFFLRVTSAADSGEVTRAMINTNERLRATRRLEAYLFADLDAEVARLMLEGARPGEGRLGPALADYHRRRLLHVAQLVGLSYQDYRERN